MSNTVAYEREIKVFGIKEVDKIVILLDRLYKRCVYDADITILKMNNKKKVKLIHEFDTDSIYLQYKTKLDGADKVREENELFNVDDKESRRILEFLGYTELYRGVKRRYKWSLSDSRNITYDEWIDGPLKGISFFELETVDENDTVDFRDLLFSIIRNAGIDLSNLESDIFTVNFGTLTLYNVLNKMTKGTGTLNIAKYHNKLLKQKGAVLVHPKNNNVKPEDVKWEVSSTSTLKDTTLENRTFTSTVVSYKILKETIITVLNGDKKPKIYKVDKYYSQEDYHKLYSKEMSKNKDHKSSIMAFIKTHKFKLIKQD